MSTTLAPAAVQPKKNRNFHPMKWVWGAVALVVSVIWVFPVYWMVNSSMLSTVVLERTTPTFLPFGGSLANFRAVFDKGTFQQALGISIVVAVVVVTACLFFAFLAALAISRFRFRGRKTFILVILLVQMLPAEGMFIAQYRLLKGLGESVSPVIGLNSILGLSIIYTAAVVPFTIWMLRGFVAGVPADLEEAAMVDGLTRTQAFLRITFPLLAPGLVASGVYAFLQAWNEFTVALVIMQSESMATLPLWLRSFLTASASRQTDWGQVMAASTLVAIPVIIFFVLVQGRMTSGLVSGAVKG
ncbi:carbohydrate ABC transporter permease [Scrofimicrobium sp. R131]|uniref:Carbohydrate ABC transporter permease n=1 Tax=Scrofimicrobium appendicitidis TaxID=3079930 RepID=A0AAU7V638_9ACTO